LEVGVEKAWIARVAEFGIALALHIPRQAELIEKSFRSQSFQAEKILVKEM
jgi:hypothetical protein